MDELHICGLDVDSACVLYEEGDEELAQTDFC